MLTFFYLYAKWPRLVPHSKSGLICPVFKCHLNTKPFTYRTALNHLTTGLTSIRMVTVLKFLYLCLSNRIIHSFNKLPTFNSNVEAFEENCISLVQWIHIQINSSPIIIKDIKHVFILVLGDFKCIWWMGYTLPFFVYLAIGDKIKSKTVYYPNKLKNTLKLPFINATSREQYTSDLNSGHPYNRQIWT